MNDSKSGMLVLPGSQHVNPERVATEKQDLAGRDRLVSNVIFGWASHLVFIVSGFIMPRMIDQSLGQELLGVWDFSWSLVSYFRMVQLGITSSVNRYVAKYRAAGDVSGVNSIVSSASCILGASAILVVCLTITVSVLMPQWFGARLGENITEAQWVLFLLGISLAVQIGFGAFNGVITGCHRWALQNIVRSGIRAAIVAAMIVALLVGGRLRVLAAINLVGMLLAGLTSVILAYRVCDGLQLGPSSVQWRTIRNVFVFGGKTLIPSVSNLLLNQTTSILIVAYFGPAALALYTRPRSLMHHIDNLVRKMAMVLIPTTSSLQSTGGVREIQELLIKSVRYSFYMVLPMVLVMVIFGGPIMQFWMGPRYANGIVPAILAAGLLAALAQGPLQMILTGINAHGRAGLSQFIASVCSVVLTVLALGYLKWGIVGAAVAVTLPLTILNVTYLPYLTCRRLNIDMKRYFLSVTLGPASHVLPFALCLIIARVVSRTEMLISLVICGIGVVILTILYWRCVLPNRLKRAILHYPRSLLGVTGSLNETTKHHEDPSSSSTHLDMDT